ncbi:protein RAFTIN 1A [Gossypium hirsutum]|uniref:Protein RAFTIN 1A n=1 Tax=Gossypium hirsutum TaxID=3635 RepID=A0ABM2YJC8_GOSHI|nr:protein RAFTIN 1A-like [Gossypium hirsutum]
MTLSSLFAEELPPKLGYFGSHGTVLEEVYWKSVFPNNPMPKALKDILPPSGQPETAKVSKSNHGKRFELSGSEGDEEDKYNDLWGSKLSGSEGEESGEDAYVDDWRSKLSGVQASGGQEAYADDWSSKLSGSEGEESGEDAYADDWRSKLSGGQEAYADDWSSKLSGSEGEESGEDAYVDDWSSKLSRNHGNGEDAYFDNWRSKLRGNHGNGEDAYFDDWRSKLSGSQGNSEDEYFDTWRSKPSSNNGNEEFDDWDHDFSARHGNGEEALKESKAASDRTPFLPDRVAKSIPFSSSKFPEILNHFSLKPQTREAEIMKRTIGVCEREAINGEQMFCVRSLESFIDLSIATLGKEIQLLSNQLSKETNNPLFTIARGMQDMGENELICHKERYPRAVFFCHSINKTTLYKVPLLGRDGTKANALAVCHKDTSAWSPKHIAFQILEVKPGTVPICHFLAKDTLAWVSN